MHCWDRKNPLWESLPVLPFRLQCPGQVVAPLQDKEASPARPRGFSAARGARPWQSWEMLWLSSRRSLSAPELLGCLTCHFSLALLMTQLPPSLVWLVWVSLELSLCSGEGFVSGGCTSECSWQSRGAADDNPDCTRCAVTLIYFSHLELKKRRINMEYFVPHTNVLLFILCLFFMSGFCYTCPMNFSLI